MRGDIDGVAAFWVPTGRPTLTASLIVRQGMVDETLPTTGWTHLLEHLALHDRASGPLHVNGSVSLLHTRFDAHGPADRVADMLSALSRWLADPDFDELGREQSVLRAEAALRGGGEVPSGLLWRYGARGPGLSAYAEPGLSRSSAGELTTLAGTIFNRGNCVLFLDGPPPPALSLELPPGDLRRTPVATPCDDTLPAAYLINAGVTLSGVVPRSHAATVLPHVLREVLTAQFRQRDGGAYAPWAHYEPVDDSSAVVFAGSDANQELLLSIVDRSIDELDRLARGELESRLVEDTVEQLVQATTDPYNLPVLAYRAAVDHLRGEEPVGLAQVLDEYRSIDVDAVRRAAAVMRDSLMVGFARQARWTQQMPVLEMPTGEVKVPGRSHRSRNYPAHREQLVVGADAVQVGAAKSYRTVRRDDIAGMLVYPDGAREVIARDGWSINVEPTLWAAGADAAERIDAMVPPQLHIPMLERDSDRVPQPMSAWRRLRHWFDQAGRSRPQLLTLVLAVVWLALVVVATVATGRVPVGGIVAGLGVATWSFLRQRRS